MQPLPLLLHLSPSPALRSGRLRCLQAQWWTAPSATPLSLVSGDALATLAAAVLHEGSWA